MSSNTLKIDVRPWGGWEHCLHMRAGQLELVATLAVGPRVLHFGLAGKRSEFLAVPGQLGATGGRRWRMYGGHRFWYAPEKAPYPPDNAQLAWTKKGKSGVHFVQPVEKSTGLQKELSLFLDPEHSRVRALHTLTNKGKRTRRVAPWALTVLKPGGEVILPLPRRGTHPQDLQAAGTFVLWAYTDLGDKRWKVGPKLVRYFADPKVKHPQKLGMWSKDGWIAHRRGKNLLVIRAKPISGKAYPDLGSNIETWGRHNMVELETLGPMEDLRPGKSLQHEETWTLGQLRGSASNDEHLEKSIRRLAGIA